MATRAVFYKESRIGSAEPTTTNRKSGAWGTRSFAEPNFDNGACTRIGRTERKYSGIDFLGGHGLFTFGSLVDCSRNLCFSTQLLRSANRQPDSRAACHGWSDQFTAGDAGGGRTLLGCAGPRQGSDPGRRIHCVAPRAPFRCARWGGARSRRGPYGRRAKWGARY